MPGAPKHREPLDREIAAAISRAVSGLVVDELAKLRAIGIATRDVLDVFYALPQGREALAQRREAMLAELELLEKSGKGRSAVSATVRKFAQNPTEVESLSRQLRRWRKTDTVPLTPWTRSRFDRWRQKRQGLK